MKKNHENLYVLKLTAFAHSLYMEIKRLFEHKFLSPFFAKSYGLELLTILLDAYPREIEGVENLFDTLQSPKPRYRTFLNHIDLLNQMKIVEFNEGARKKSAKTIKLTEIFFYKCHGAKIADEE